MNRKAPWIPEADSIGAARILRLPRARERRSRAHTSSRGHPRTPRSMSAAPPDAAPSAEHRQLAAQVRLRRPFLSPPCRPPPLPRLAPARGPSLAVPPTRGAAAPRPRRGCASPSAARAEGHARREPGQGSERALQASGAGVHARACRVLCRPAGGGLTAPLGGHKESGFPPERDAPARTPVC